MLILNLSTFPRCITTSTVLFFLHCGFIWFFIYPMFSVFFSLYHMELGSWIFLLLHWKWFHSPSIDLLRLFCIYPMNNGFLRREKEKERDRDRNSQTRRPWEKYYGQNLKHIRLFQISLIFWRQPQHKKPLPFNIVAKWMK